MIKTALLFAGQGAQVVGMGRDWARELPTARSWFDRANAALGYDLAALCFDGPEAELTRTENAQPGIFLVSWVALQLLRERVPGLSFQATAGLSLGEFTALTAAGGAGVQSLTDTSTATFSPSRVALFGGFRGGGMSTTTTAFFTPRTTAAAWRSISSSVTGRVFS